MARVKLTLSLPFCLVHASHFARPAEGTESLKLAYGVGHMAARTLRSSPFWSRKPGLLVVLSPTVACLNRPYSASLSSLLALSGTLSFASCVRGKQSVGETQQTCESRAR